MDQFTREFAANNNKTTLRYWTVPLLHQNLRGATLSSKDIPISPYTKGKNNNSNNNIVSSLVQYSSWIINLYFKVIQVLFFCLVTEITCEELPPNFILYFRHISQYRRHFHSCNNLVYCNPFQGYNSGERGFGGFTSKILATNDFDGFRKRTYAKVSKILLKS